MNAHRNDWKREKFRRLTKIPFTDEFDPKEMARLRQGLVPNSKEDKWFVFFRGKTLYFHRSWTGQGVYQIRLKLRKDGSGIVRWAKCSKDVMVIDRRYEAALLEFIVGYLLLDYDIPFPLHDKVEDDEPGVFQYAVTGTKQTEVTVNKKSLKSRFK